MTLWRTTLALVTEPEGELFADAHELGVTRDVRGAILQRYYDEGGPATLGLPTSGERPITVNDLAPYGDREVTFRAGIIVMDSRSGETTLLRLREENPEA